LSNYKKKSVFVEKILDDDVIEDAIIDEIVEPVQETEDEVVVEDVPVAPLVDVPIVRPYPGPIRIGHKGDSVVLLQNALINKGFDVEPDGVFDTGTSGALRHFERSIGSTNDGILGPEVWVALNA
jgi:peptidoglycan hydrolase-like protein with peptidoglycan-binding domain